MTIHRFVPAALPVLAMLHGCLADEVPSAGQGEAGAGAMSVGVGTGSIEADAGAPMGSGGTSSFDDPFVGQAGAPTSSDASADAGVMEPPADVPVDPLAVPDGCVPIEVATFPGQIWAIVALNLLRAEMVVQNVSGRVQELNTNYQWCAFPKYERLLPLDVQDPANLQTRQFAPGEVLWVNLVEGDNAEGEDAVRIEFERSGGEIAIYDGPGTYRDPDRMLAFLSWDGGNPTEGREAVAAQAGLWDYSDRVELDPSWAGIVATGDTRVSEGYTSVPTACLPKRIP